MDSMDMSKKESKVMWLADDKLDAAVYLWFTEKRSEDMPACKKAAQLLGLLHEGESVPPFQASKGWNTAALFTKRKVFSDITMVEPFKKELQ